MCAIKIGIILLDVCLHSAKPETFTAIRMCVASEARPINVIPARVTIYIHIGIIKRDLFFVIAAAESTEYIDGTGLVNYEKASIHHRKIKKTK